MKTNCLERALKISLAHPDWSRAEVIDAAKRTMPEARGVSPRIRSGSTPRPKRKIASLHRIAELSL
jgi:hypothetical protein